MRFLIQKKHHQWRGRQARLWAAGALALLLGALPPAGAATHTVTSLADSGAGTLRSKIVAAASGDTIEFAVVGTITLTSGQLVIGRDITINAPYVLRVTVSGNHASRVFQILPAVTVRISNLTIADGFARGADGAPGGTNSTDRTPAMPGSPGRGGGILNDGNLTLIDCMVRGNRAQGGIGGLGLHVQGALGGDAEGGGVHNAGSLMLVNCTFYENHSVAGDGAATSFRDIQGGQGGNARGGGIYASGFIEMVNATFALNAATGGNGGRGGFALPGAGCRGGPGGDGGFGVGGAIASLVSLTSVNSTIAGNATSGGAGGSGGPNPSGLDCLPGPPGAGGSGLGGGLAADGVAVLLNTIVGDNFCPNSPDVFGRITSQGHNFIERTDGSSGWVASDITGTIATPRDPKLGPLGNNGGPTLNKALLPASLAIDAGDDSVLTAPYNLTTDQRGAPRRTGAHVDIGGYEFGGATRYVTTLANSGVGSLRNALSLAMESDRIVFAPEVTGKIILTTGELLVDKLLYVIGPGAARLAISGNNTSRVFHVGPHGSVEMYDLTITEGFVQAPQAAPAQPGTESRGAGLLNEGSLRLFDCMLTTNKAHAGSGGSGWPGGTGQPVDGGPGGSGKGAAIYSSGSLALTRCTLVGNRALGGDGGRGSDALSPGWGGGAGAGEGGAVWSTAVTSLENCTLADNHVVGGRGGNPGSDQFDNDAPPGTGGNGLGGALQGPFALESCTITGNSVTPGLGGQGVSLTGAPGVAGGGGVNAPGALTLHNSIIAGNSGTNSPDVAGAVTSQGWNLIGISDGSSGWRTNDLLGNAGFPLTPLLSACQDNGGPVWTIGPLAGSPARNAGDSGLPTDARGGPRIVDFPNAPNAPGGDIGALEVDALFRITSISMSNTVARVKFKSDPGSLYTLQQTSLVTNHTWTNIVGTLTGNGQELEATDTGPLVPGRFYRVRSH